MQSGCRVDERGKENADKLRGADAEIDDSIRRGGLLRCKTDLISIVGRAGAELRRLREEHGGCCCCSRWMKRRSRFERVWN